MEKGSTAERRREEGSVAVGRRERSADGSGGAGAARWERGKNEASRGNMLEDSRFKSLFSAVVSEATEKVYFRRLSPGLQK